MLLSDTKLLIDAYDDDKDGDLEYKEFEKLVLSATNASLKYRAKDRLETFVGYRDKLHYAVESNLSRLMKAEIDRLKDLLLDKKALTTRYDFSRYDCFKLIDQYRMNSILRDDLRSFLNRNGVYANSLDVDNLMRRIDMDQDGRITYSELCDFIEQGAGASVSAYSRTPEKASLRNSYSPIREDRYSRTEARREIDFDMRNSSPLRQTLTP